MSSGRDDVPPRAGMSTRAMVSTRFHRHGAAVPGRERGRAGRDRSRFCGFRGVAHLGSGRTLRMAGNRAPRGRHSRHRCRSGHGPLGHPLVGGSAINPPKVADSLPIAGLEAGSPGLSRVGTAGQLLAGYDPQMSVGGYDPVRSKCSHARMLALHDDVGVARDQVPLVVRACSPSGDSCSVGEHPEAHAVQRTRETADRSRYGCGGS